jgi:glycosyltransferase involved in cell wall biosynthesis
LSVVVFLLRFYFKYNTLFVLITKKNRSTVSRKNIAFVVFEPQMSGQGRAVADILANTAGDFGYFLICQRSNSGLGNFCKGLVEDILPLKISKFINMDILKAYRFIRKNNISLIHLHGFEGLLWGHALAVIARVPVVFTPHTIDMRNRFLFFWYTVLWRICSRYVSMLITVSNEDAKTVLKRRILPAAKVLPILLGVDRSRFLKIPPPKHIAEGAEGKKWIVQVGHLSYQKNPFCLIRAAERLLSKNSDMIFMFVGEGPLRSQIEEEISRRGLEKGVMVLGHRDDALSITMQAWIVVNTSRWEGMPFTLIDACFMGKPIVASAVNGTMDLINEGVSGLLFTPDRDEELAQKIHILACNDSLRRQLGRQAKQSVCGSHEMQTMGTLHGELYTSVLRQTG